MEYVNFVNNLRVTESLMNEFQKKIYTETGNIVKAIIGKGILSGLNVRYDETLKRIIIPPGSIVSGDGQIIDIKTETVFDNFEKNHIVIVKFELKQSDEIHNDLSDHINKYYYYAPKISVIKEDSSLPSDENEYVIIYHQDRSKIIRCFVSSDVLNEMFSNNNGFSVMCPFPIGYQYQQYPEEDGMFDSNSDPNHMFPGTQWEKMWNGKGVFARTEGDQSDHSRISGVQEEHFKNTNIMVDGHHTHVSQPHSHHWGGLKLPDHRHYFEALGRMLGQFIVNKTEGSESIENRWLPTLNADKPCTFKPGTTTSSICFMDNYGGEINHITGTTYNGLFSLISGDRKNDINSNYIGSSAFPLQFRNLGVCYKDKNNESTVVYPETDPSSNSFDPTNKTADTTIELETQPNLTFNGVFGNDSKESAPKNIQFIIWKRVK